MLIFCVYIARVRTQAHCTHICSNPLNQKDQCFSRFIEVRTFEPILFRLLFTDLHWLQLCAEHDHICLTHLLPDKMYKFMASPHRWINWCFLTVSYHHARLHSSFKVSIATHHIFALFIPLVSTAVKLKIKNENSCLRIDEILLYYNNFKAVFIRCTLKSNSKKFEYFLVLYWNYLRSR